MRGLGRRGLALQWRWWESEKGSFVLASRNMKALDMIWVSDSMGVVWPHI